MFNIIKAISVVLLRLLKEWDKHVIREELAVEAFREEHKQEEIANAIHAEDTPRDKLTILDGM